MTNAEKTLMIEQMQKDNTEGFELEFGIDRKLRQVDAEEYSNMELVALGDTEEVKPGQLRVVTYADSWYYVVIIKKWDEGMWLCTPLSPYQAPANEEELLLSNTDDQVPRAHVAQAWATFTCCTETLQKASMMYEKDWLPADERHNVLKLWNSTFSEIELPPGVQSRTGASVRTKLMQEYFEQEMENQRPFLDLDLDLTMACPE